MNESELFSDSIDSDQAHLAERELSSFIRAVTELFGPEQAGVSTEDWLEEAALMDSPPLSTRRNWRSVTVAASARLASRIDEAQRRQSYFSAPVDAKVSPMPLSDCFVSALLA